MQKKLILTALVASAALLFSPVVMAKNEAQNVAQHEIKNHAKKPVSTAVVDINNANVSQLATLKRIGAKKAAAIVAYRTENGNFKSVDDLAKVKGVSQGIVDANKGRLKLS